MSNVFILAALYTERRLAVVSPYNYLHTFSLATQIFIYILLLKIKLLWTVVHILPNSSVHLVIDFVIVFLH